MSATMVRAILAGQKCQTRRLVTPQPSCARTADDPHGWRWKYQPRRKNAPLVEWGTDTRAWGGLFAYAPWAVGDRLWVKEAIRAWTYVDDDESCVEYVADGQIHDDAAWVWKRDSLPGMFMPRGLSRLTLTITGVRVERLQHISEADAKAEGVQPAPGYTYNDGSPVYRDPYRDLWNELNAARGYGWDVNPWVWVVSFERTTEGRGDE